MHRFITEKLTSWKAKTNRKPLILRGARQVGKTWAIRDFGKQHFHNVHLVDLERHPEWHRIFEVNLDPARIISELEILLNTTINPGKDLLFLDEIQSYPRAVMALRYFYEDMPDLHVITAGSLLEFALQDISFPVGRVQTLSMHPMNFVEFLTAMGKTRAAEVVQSPPKKLSENIHLMLLEQVRNYFFVGGMPESVLEYSQAGKIRSALAVQEQLADTFRQDFSKYAPYADKTCLNAVFSTVAKNVGRQIKYARLAEGFTNPTIKKAFDLLCMARVLRKVSAASPEGLPLGASASARKFKAIMVDVGLMQSLCDMPVDIEYGKADLLAIYKGALAEQFVGQELLTADRDELYYWSRDAKGSTAEVDYLVPLKGEIYPIEVKSGPAGKLKSLHLLLKTFPNSGTGVVFSGAPYSNLPEQKLIFLPLYYAWQFFSIGR